MAKIIQLFMPPLISLIHPHVSTTARLSAAGRPLLGRVRDQESVSIMQTSEFIE